jgi:hypothetical protein
LFDANFARFRRAIGATIVFLVGSFAKWERTVKYISFYFVAALCFWASAAQADLSFSSTLSGGAERPNPTNSTATGTATGILSGGPGTYVFTYQVNYSGITGASINGAHIHQVSPGTDPLNESGGIVHGLDNSASPTVPSGTFSGNWRYDDATNPLTDTRAQALLGGLDYFNIHSQPNFAGGEIRGQIILVPEPSSLALLGLAGAGLLVRRRFN